MSERIYNNNPVDAILLGGKDSNGIGFNSRYKFTLEFGERDILEVVLRALDNTTTIDRVFFVGPLELINERVKERKRGYITIPETGSLWGNLSEAIERQQQLRGSNEVLVVCSDLPFLSAASMDYMVTSPRANDKLQIPIVPRDRILELSPIYQTYYWPMREYPFKWSNNMLLNVGKVNNGSLENLFFRYRDTGGDNYGLSALKRMRLLNEYGGPEAVYTLLLNYASKLLQIKIEGGVPFSKLRSKSDYERVISKIIGIDSELVQTPFIDTVLDVDNHLRLGIFQRGYKEIKKLLEAPAVGP